MSPNVQALRRASVVITGLSLVLVLLAWGTSVHARVTRIVIDIKTSPAFGGATFGDKGQYETIAGRAFGELDPNLNAWRTRIRGYRCGSAMSITTVTSKP